MYTAICMLVAHSSHHITAPSFMRMYNSTISSFGGIKIVTPLLTDPSIFTINLTEVGDRLFIQSMLINQSVKTVVERS